MKICKSCKIELKTSSQEKFCDECFDIAKTSALAQAKYTNINKTIKELELLIHNGDIQFVDRRRREIRASLMDYYKTGDWNPNQELVEKISILIKCLRLKVNEIKKNPKSFKKNAEIKKTVPATLSDIHKLKQKFTDNKSDFNEIVKKAEIATANRLKSNQEMKPKRQMGKWSPQIGGEIWRDD